MFREDQFASLFRDAVWAPRANIWSAWKIGFELFYGKISMNVSATIASLSMGFGKALSRRAIFFRDDNMLVIWKPWKSLLNISEKLMVEEVEAVKG